MQRLTTPQTADAASAKAADQLDIQLKGSAWHYSLPCFHESREIIYHTIWVVVKIMVPFWVLIIIRHLIFRVPKKGP